MKRCHQALCAFLPAAALAVAALHAHAVEPQAALGAPATKAMAGAYRGIYDVRRNFDFDGNARADRPKFELLRGRDAQTDFAGAANPRPLAAGEPLKRDAVVRWSLPGPAHPTAWFGWAAASSIADNRKGEPSGFAEFGVSWSF